MAYSGSDIQEGAGLLYNYLLIVRFALTNLVAFALLVAAYLQGWLDGVLNAHLMELSVFIFLVFLYGLVICGAKIWHHSVEINTLKNGKPDPESRAGRYLRHTAGANPDSRSIHLDTMRLKLTDGIVVVRHIANGLVFLGLIGTVIGFIIALSGVNPSAATQVENAAAMVSTLINGMSVALYTTLVGAVLYVWLNVNYRLLTTGTVDLIASIVEASESRGRT
ncbi:MAG: MotA/TolQ/ExbB proton channel family protein [Rhodospirillales bacterium]